MNIMNKPSKNMKIAQSILNYLGFLVLIVLALGIGIGVFGKAVKSGLNTAQKNMADKVQESLDDTYKATVVTFPGR